MIRFNHGVGVTSERKHAVTGHLLDNPLMPQPIDCNQCGELSVVHTVQYVYQRTVDDQGVPEHLLRQIVTVVECPTCGIHSQIVDVQDDT